MIVVIAELQIVPGGRRDFLKLFHELVPKVHAEDGCVEYGPTADLETSIEAQAPLRPDVVTVVEKWDSPAALERHLIAPHMIEFRGAAKSLIEGMTLRILEPA